MIKGNWLEYWRRRTVSRDGVVTYTNANGEIVGRGTCNDTDRGRNWVWHLTFPVDVKGRNTTRAEAYDAMGTALLAALKGRNEDGAIRTA